MSTVHVVSVEQDAAGVKLIGAARTRRGAKALGDEHLNGKRDATDQRTGDDTSAVTRGTPTPESDWEAQDDGSFTKSFTTGYHVRITKLRVND